MIDVLSGMDPSLFLKERNMANEGYHEAIVELADEARTCIERPPN